MGDHVYKTIEITGTSTQSIEDATTLALKKATASVRSLRWFEVTDIRGAVSSDGSPKWQVTVKIGFRLDD